MSWEIYAAVVSTLGLLLGSLVCFRVFFTPPPASSPPEVVKRPLKSPPLVKMIYVLADMRGRTLHEARDSRLRVQQQFVQLLRSGLYPVCVGVNTEQSMRDFALPAIFQEGAKELAGRCDGLFLMTQYDEDSEAISTLAYAQGKGVKIFMATEHNLAEKLKLWATDED